MSERELPPDLQSVVDQLNAERYGRSVWWNRPEDARPTRHDELAERRRRRKAERDLATHDHLEHAGDEL